MADFRFLHAADIHLDSPLSGLSSYDGAPAEEMRGATRAAFDALIDLALTEVVDFVVIAGDLFDGDWRDMSTGLYFARAMGRLAKAGVPAFVLAGNHDAASVLTKSLPWPETVRVFRSNKPETFHLPDLGVALHGQSFPTQQVYDDLAERYPSPEPGVFNIGVLHTALAGTEGHAPYAPCSLAGLQAKGYHYWALGHVHDHQVLCVRPHVVFPGVLQGRNIRETGPKGAVVVEVRDREVSALRFVALDVARWARVDVDCGGADTRDAVWRATRRALEAAYAREAERRPLAVRVTLSGPTPLAGPLRSQPDQVRAEVQALAAAVSPDIWLEKLTLRLSNPSAQAPADLPEDLVALLAEATDDAALATELADDLAAFMAGVNRGEGGAPGELLTAALAGDWAALLRTGANTLPARLGAEHD